MLTLAIVIGVIFFCFFSSVQCSCSVVSDSWIPAPRPPCPSPRPTQSHVPRVGDATQPSHPLSSPSPPAPNPSQHQSLFQWVNSSHIWGGQSIGVSALAIIPSEEIPGLISFRMDWLDLLAVQGTLRSLLQHHSSKASILWCSAVFTVQLSHPVIILREKP